MTLESPKPAIPGPDRGGIWPVPFERGERIMLITQAKNDRRNVPLVWYWRLLRPQDGEGATAQDSVLWESPRVHRRYAPPIAVHVAFIDWTVETKGKKRGVVQTTGTTPITVTRAETRRLGALLRTDDTPEGLVADPNRGDPVFVPRPDDIFAVRDVYYEITQLKPEWWGATTIVTRYVGAAAMLHDDAANPGLEQLPAPATPIPPEPTGVPWRG